MASTEERSPALAASVQLRVGLPRRFLLGALWLSGLLALSCYAEKIPERGGHGEPDGSGAASGEGSGGTSGGDEGSGAEAATGGDDGPDSPMSACPDAVGEPLPARVAITSDDGAPDSGSQPVLMLTKASLFRDFERQGCGVSGCHGGADEPLARSPDAFKMTLDSFDQRPDLGRAALDRVLSSDPLKVMPPGSGDGSTREPNHPVRRLAERLFAWEEAGFPESFQIAVDDVPVAPPLPTEPYLLSPALGAKLTSIGSCVPSQAMLLERSVAVMDELEQVDARFAALASSEELPDTLAETDLVSLDSAVLARRNVFSYAPTYTLFSDNAGKMRHVRVPVGKVIRYNPQTQDFDIPDDTRFYKTFLRAVKDKDGKVGYRKMETRLIVVRRDEALPGGGYRPRALRAAYAWDRDERMARRVKDPLRSGSPAADRLCPVIVDETVTRDPQKNPISEEASEFCEFMTQAERDDPRAGRIRHYAIPSTERCDQCHMGSNNRSYVLGFSPWQVDRRPSGQGGIYEDPTDHELTQLSRLLEYGVIEGIAPGEAKLEESQGNRMPRNEYELKAQGYMIGNCAFCHNPNGFPVVQNPLLRVLDMYPSESGGIFQFPLDTMSPRAKVGPGQAIEVPYITPSFGDFQFEGSQQFKRISLYPPPLVDALGDAPDYDRGTFEHVFLGPWRSLIWRNVYTPFTYAEEGTIFVHMPRNAPGFDCRAQKIMGEWMVSIPALERPTSAQQSQPMQEFREEERGYNQARKAAETRLMNFRRSATGQHCPEDDDIVDPKVIVSPRDFVTNRKLRPVPLDDGIIRSDRVLSEANGKLPDQVPDHAHWVPTDTTDLPGKWVPRRPNWRALIATRDVEVPEKLERVIETLQSIHLSPALESFALEPLPMGLWHPECQSHPTIADAPSVRELTEDSQQPFRRWLQRAVFATEAPVPADQRVHTQSRGEAVFRAICQNCHGKQADSKSPLAATIIELTGGQTRVANFLSGLFGPMSRPGAFARDEFLIDYGATPEDWQARYLLFMGLGGTQAELPSVVLNLVATSPVYGKSFPAPGGGDPNMLDSAQQLCARLLWHQRALPNPIAGRKPAPVLSGSGAFVAGTAHYELWESLCTMENEPVVLVFHAPSGFDPPGTPTAPSTTGVGGFYRAQDDDGAWIYPPDHPVGTATGTIEDGVQPSNKLPWCVRITSDLDRKQVEAWLEDWGIRPERAPICPSSLFVTALGHPIHELVQGEGPFGNREFAARWARRGAMNAGLVAYYYLRGVTRGGFTPSRAFDFCRE